MSVVGLRVGPFEVVEAVVVPEKGTWYLARRSGITRKQPNEVLVKLAPPDATSAERMALQAEFDHLRAVESFRVPSPLAFYDGLGALVIAAPRCIPLAEIAEARRTAGVALSPATLMDLALEVADTLQHAHHRSRPHGHVCPGEIGLALDGRVWVFGFGPGPYATPAAAWTAPERARGEAPTPATDQWGLAAMLASLVTGREPWIDLEDAVKGDPTAFVAPVEAQWPALGRVLRRMLDPVPAHRYPSMIQVRQELFALARRAGGVSDRRSLALRLHRMRNPELPSDPGSDPGMDARGHTSTPPAEPTPPPAAARENLPTDELETVEVARQPSLPLFQAPISVTGRPAPTTPSGLPEPASNPDIAKAVMSTGVRLDRNPLRAAALPHEAIPVVRPAFGADLPRAVLGSGDPASAPDPELAGFGAGFRLRRAPDDDSDAEVVEPTSERPLLSAAPDLAARDPGITEPSSGISDAGASDAGVVDHRAGEPPSLVDTATDRTAAPRIQIPASSPPPEPALNSPSPRVTIPRVPTSGEDEPGMSVPGPAAIGMIRPRGMPIPTPVMVELDDLEELEEVEAEDAGDEPSFDLGARDDETDGFHLPPSLADSPTRFPTNTRSDPGFGPTFSAVAPRLAGPALGASMVHMPAGHGDASSLGDGWFGPGGASAAASGPASGPGIALDAPVGVDVDASPAADYDTIDPDDGPDEIRPLRIPPLQMSVAQRVAPIAVAMMFVSLTVWTVVQIWT